MKKWLTTILSIGLILSLTVPGWAAKAPGLITEYRFEGNANDSSGNSEDGSIDGATLTTGKSGQAYSFDGGNDKIDLPVDGNLPLYTTSGYSIVLWLLNADTTQVTQWFYSEARDASNNPFLGLISGVTDSTALHASVRDDAADIKIDADTTTTLTEDVWYHIAWTDDNGTAKFYINGVLDGTDFSYTPGALTLDRSTIGCLGRGANSAFFEGRVDEFRHYSRVLPEGEIRQLMLGFLHGGM